MLLHHVGDTVCNYSGLARACTCKYEQRAVKMGYRLSLLFVKAFKHAVGILVRHSFGALAVDTFELPEKLI